MSCSVGRKYFFQIGDSKLLFCVNSTGVPQPTLENIASTRIHVIAHKTAVNMEARAAW